MLLKYEELLNEIEQNNLDLYEFEMNGGIRGLCIGNSIVLNKEIDRQDERNCVLAEEIGHYKTTVGDITGNDNDSRRQELKARAYAYDTLIGLNGLVKAWTAGNRGYSEAADYLCVTEEFFRSAVEYYTNKYGLSTEYEGNTIRFVPYLEIKPRNK